MTSSRIQNLGWSAHAKSWHVHISQVMTSACIVSHDNALILLEFEIILEEGSSNVAIIKKIVLVTQFLQLKSVAKPTNKESSRAPLRNASLKLALNIDVKQLKNHKLVAGNPFQRFSSGILVLMWKLGISGIEANEKNYCARDATTLYRHLQRLAYHCPKIRSLV